MNRRNLLSGVAAGTLALASGTGVAAATGANGDTDRVGTDCSPACCRDCPGICLQCHCSVCVEEAD